MNSAAEPTGTIDIALTHARRLLEDNPVLAAEQAGEILKVVPNHPLATLLLAVARRLSGDAASARGMLEGRAAEAATRPRRWRYWSASRPRSRIGRRRTMN